MATNKLAPEHMTSTHSHYCDGLDCLMGLRASACHDRTLDRAWFKL